MKINEKKAENTPAGGVLVGKKDGQTIIHDEGTMSGYLVGKLHKDGGIKAVNKATGQPLEMQGGEVVITAPAVADQTKREFEGKMMTNREILSAINEKGGGVAFAEGGEVPEKFKTSGASYNYGGKTMTDHEILTAMNGGGHLSKGKSLKQIAQMHNVSLAHINEELAKGLEVEKEHFADFKERTRVAKDHLVENPNYYTLLHKAGLKRGGEVKEFYRRTYADGTFKDFTIEEYENMMFNGGHIQSQELVEKSKKGDTPARDLNNYNDVLDLEADGEVGGESGLAFADGGVTPYDANSAGDSVPVLNGGGGVEPIKVEKIKFVKNLRTWDEVYALELLGREYSSFDELKKDLKSAYEKNKAQGGFNFIVNDDLNKKFSFVFNDKKNTVRNFNPLSGKNSDFFKQIERSYPRTIKNYDFSGWLSGNVVAPKVPNIVDLKNTKVWLGEDYKLNSDLIQKIQEKAFELGWGWGYKGADKVVKDIQAQAFYFNDQNEISYTSAISGRDAFDNEKGRELTPEQILGIQTPTSTTAPATSNKPVVYQIKVYSTKRNSGESNVSVARSFEEYFKIIKKLVENKDELDDKVDLSIFNEDKIVYATLSLSVEATTFDLLTDDEAKENLKDFLFENNRTVDFKEFFSKAGQKTVEKVILKDSKNFPDGQNIYTGSGILKLLQEIYKNSQSKRVGVEIDLFVDGQAENAPLTLALTDVPSYDYEINPTDINEQQLYSKFKFDWFQEYNWDILFPPITELDVYVTESFQPNFKTKNINELFDKLNEPEVKNSDKEIRLIWFSGTMGQDFGMYFDDNPTAYYEVKRDNFTLEILREKLEGWFFGRLSEDYMYPDGRFKSQTPTSTSGKEKIRFLALTSDSGGYKNVSNLTEVKDTIETIFSANRGKDESIILFANGLNGSSFTINFGDNRTCETCYDTLTDGKQRIKDIILFYSEADKYDWSDFFEEAQTTTSNSAVPKTLENTVYSLELAVSKLEKASSEVVKKYNTDIYEKSLKFLYETKASYELALKFTPESAFMYERLDLMKKLANIEKEIKKIEDMKQGGTYFMLAKILEKLERGESWKLMEQTQDVITNQIPQSEIEVIIRSQKFKNWFGDWEKALINDEYDNVSKALTDGKPSVYHHGARRIKYTYREVSNGVLYLAENISYALWFSQNATAQTEEGNYLTECFVNIKNPIDLTAFHVNQVDFGDIVRYIEAIYPLAKIYDFIPPNVALLIKTYQPTNLMMWAWQLIRTNARFVNHIKENTPYDGFLYYENNPSDQVLNPRTGEYEENVTKAVAIFKSPQVKVVDAVLFDGGLDDWRFEQGGKLNN